MIPRRHPKFGPKTKEHIDLLNKFPQRAYCQCCEERFKEGDYTTLVPLGPGPDKEAQKLSRQGRPFNALCIEIHYQCATGRDPLEKEEEHQKEDFH
jgi:hypothetical protein